MTLPACPGLRAVLRLEYGGQGQLGATRWNGILMAGTKEEARDEDRRPQLTTGALPAGFTSPFTVKLRALDGQELQASPHLGSWEEALAVMEKWFHSAQPGSSVSIYDAQRSLCYMAFRGGVPFSQLAALPLVPMAEDLWAP